MTLGQPERWRVGRKLGRTIYLQVGPEPSDDDVLIGMMDVPEDAQLVVSAVNWMWTRALGEEVTGG